MLKTEKRKGDNRNFGGREHWGAYTTNGVKQGISRDSDS